MISYIKNLISSIVTKVELGSYTESLPVFYLINDAKDNLKILENEHQNFVEEITNSISQIIDNRALKV